MMVMLHECSLGLGPEQATGKKACTVRTATDLQYCTAGEGISTLSYDHDGVLIWWVEVTRLLLHRRRPSWGLMTLAQARLLQCRLVLLAHRILQGSRHEIVCAVCAPAEGTGSRIRFS